MILSEVFATDVGIHSCKSDFCFGMYAGGNPWGNIKC